MRTPKEMVADFIANGFRDIRGAGDVVELITVATGIKRAVEYVNGGPCGGCGQRQQQLNEAFPIGRRPAAETEVT